MRPLWLVVLCVGCGGGKETNSAKDMTAEVAPDMSSSFTDGSTSGDAAIAPDMGLAPPAQAAAAGFTKLTLNQGGAAGWDIDDGSGAPGHAWYLGGFDGLAGKPGDFSVANGVLTINNAVTGGNYNYTLGTAQSASNTDGYVGTVYGGGYYAEASISISSTCKSSSNGWPAFWGEPIEHFAHGGVADHWPNQVASYEHYVELDFMEFWQSGICSSGPCYTFANLDWYGVYGMATPSCNKTNFCDLGNDNGGGGLVPINNVASQVPASTNWSSSNTFGALVVPSSLNNGNGYTQAYFNDAKATSQANTWSTYDPTAAPPPGKGQVFAITDIQNYVVILGTGPSCPMQVSYVRVWQKP